jgi:hypothetical protein
MPNPTKKIFLLMGQSNMAGRGFVVDVEAIEDPRISVLRFDIFRQASDPLFLDKWSAGVGPGMSFAQAVLAQREDIEIGLVPCAVGGSSLARWAVGGFLYERALLMARHSRNFGGISGILWHQGESDAGSQATADTYADRLVTMLAAARRDLDVPDVPIVLGELADFLDESKQPCWRTVNAQLHAAAGELGNCAVAKADGFDHIGDTLHIDARSQRTFGQRYAACYLGLHDTDDAHAR